jgi:hypothetical protein
LLLQVCALAPAQTPLVIGAAACVLASCLVCILEGQIVRGFEAALSMAQLLYARRSLIWKLADHPGILQQGRESSSRLQKKMPPLLCMHAEYDLASTTVHSS